ncbi:hypothetical protein GCM10007981_15170 [Thermocladium modestius]|uniref:Uncharacterized protein n=1 Tax=Thermocladium modestius TaxID=62609 RepID=A0A830GXP5_9CREN|nr:hypothetical protein [Thermocladium modestius]GGP21818.1 hypothetical protein GCM10007981_15170 [Thermocladium modestius]
MVTLRELEELVQRSRRYDLKIRVRFKGTKYSVLIDKEIRALDEAGKAMSWSKAFPLAPHQALTNYPLDSVQVECGDEVIWSGKSMSELLKVIDDLKCN